MNALKLLTATALVMMTSIAFALGPAVDTLNVQGYLAQPSGQPITDGTYTFAIAVCQGGTALWGQEYSITTSGGLFTQQLVGVGGDLSTGVAGAFATGCTGADSNWSNGGAGPLDKTLNAALLQAGPAGELDIRMLAITAVDGANPQFDIPVSAVPTALVASQANQANSLPNGTVTIGMMNASAITATGGIVGDNGLIPVLSGTGQIAAAMVPNISAANITSGVLGTAQGGTGQGSLAATLTAMNGAHNGANTDITSISPPAGPLTLGGGTTTVINITPTGAGALNVGGVGNGNSTFGNTGGGVTDITGVSVDLGDAVTTAILIPAAGSSASVSIGASTGNGAISIGPAATGTGTLTVGSGSSGNAIFGNFGGGSMTELVSGTGNISIGSTTTELILPSAPFSITQGLGATGALTIATTNNENLTLSPAGTGLVNINSGAGLTGNTASFTGNLSVGTSGGDIQLGTVANGVITIAQPIAGAAWTMTLPPNAGTNNFVLATNGTGTTTWVNPGTAISSLNPAGALAVGGASTTSVTIDPAGLNASIAVAPSGTGSLTIGGAGSGNSVFGNTGGGSTTITGPTVDVGNVTTTALNLTPTGANAAVDVASNGSGLLTVGGAGTGNSVFGNTGGTSSTTIQSGSNGIIIDPGSGNPVTVGDTGGGSTTLQSPTVNLGATALTTTIATQSTGLTSLNLGGTSTSALTTTLGGTNTTSATTIQSGTGGITESGGGGTAGGGYTFTGGAATTGAAGGFSATAGSATGASGNGGGFAFTAGNTTNATGGVAGGFTFNAGSVTTSTTGGNAGSISFTSGSSTVNAGAGGPISLFAGNATGTTSTGGAVNMTGGTGTTTGGGINLTSGAGSGAGVAGAVAIAAGIAGTTTGTNGANVSVTAGPSAALGAGAVGGALTFTGGSSTLGTGGSVTVNAGAGATANGAINIGTSNTSAVNIGSAGTTLIISGSPVLPVSSAVSMGRYMSSVANPTAITLTNIGIAAPTTVGAALTNADSNTAAFVKAITNVGAANNCAGMLTSAVVGRIGGNLTFSTRISTDIAALTATRYGIGLAQTGATLAVANGCSNAANGPAQADVPTSDVAYFRGSTTVPDTNWQCITCQSGGAGCQTNNSGIAIANSTEYNMKIVTSATQVLFFINDALVCTNAVAAHLPLAATNLVGYIGVNETTAANKFIAVSNMTVTGR